MSRQQRRAEESARRRGRCTCGHRLVPSATLTERFEKDGMMLDTSVRRLDLSEVMGHIERIAAMPGFEVSDDLLPAMHGVP